jgi:peptidoglycan lytic transglycosylase
VRLVAALPLAVLAASCHRAPPPSPHYLLGAPYQADGVWYYPGESYDLRATGLAAVYPPDHPELTADGEAFHQSALAAAHQTLQLPAVARITNLENGLSILVRINDRGPATPHRMIEVTRRAAELLQIPTGAAVRVRLEVLPAESHAAVDAVPGAPELALTAAPRGEVQQYDLPPPGSTVQISAAPTTVSPRQPDAPAATAPLRLPETVTQATPDPGQLVVRLGTFQSYEYAAIRRARVAGLGARIVTTRAGRGQTHSVVIGPLANVQQADIVLDQVLRAGVTDARIVVE